MYRTRRLLRPAGRERLLMADEATGVVDQVKGVIAQIRPLLQADGGDIEFVGMEEDTGVVNVKLKGACAGCPGAAMTLKMGVERHLKEKVPQVTEVVATQ